MRSQDIFCQPYQGKYFVGFFTNDSNVLTLIENLPEKDVDIEIKPHKEKRSLDANGYYWSLVGKISRETGEASSEIYRRHVHQVGKYDAVCVTDKAVDQFCKNWESNGLGWIAEKFDSKMPNCTNVRCFPGSSQYDTKEMTNLINLCIDDCKALNIDTATPEEQARMLAEWNSR